MNHRHIETLRIIHKVFTFTDNDDAPILDVSKQGAITSLQFYNKKSPHPFLQELEDKIKASKTEIIPIIHIEQFCLQKVVDRVLERFPINVAEAYVLAVVVVYIDITIDQLYLKLGCSGLLQPTNINGQFISDIEEIAKFVINSLANAKLIYISPDTKKVYSGRELYEGSLFQKQIAF